MTPQDLRKIQSALFQWGRDNYRDYPWRHTQDPYKIMIAEFLLHRTKADQVVSVYNSFIQKYPDVFSLARADFNEIREVTEHLGLHWRSGHFIDAAQYVVEHHGGIMPRTADELLEIPGVGTYAAGAILTVCYKKPYPVVDANIARFINRIAGLDLSGEIRRKRIVIDISREIFEMPEPGRFLFALLDFTANICTARNPQHSICPLRDICGFYRDYIEK